MSISTLIVGLTIAVWLAIAGALGLLVWCTWLSDDFSGIGDE